MTNDLSSRFCDHGDDQCLVPPKRINNKLLGMISMGSIPEGQFSDSVYWRQITCILIANMNIQFSASRKGGTLELSSNRTVSSFTSHYSWFVRFFCLTYESVPVPQAWRGLSGRQRKADRVKIKAGMRGPVIQAATVTPGLPGAITYSDQEYFDCGFRHHSPAAGNHVRRDGPA